MCRCIMDAAMVFDVGIIRSSAMDLNTKLHVWICYSSRSLPSFFPNLSHVLVPLWICLCSTPVLLLPAESDPFALPVFAALTINAVTLCFAMKVQAFPSLCNLG